MTATRDALEVVIREQLTRVVSNALAAGVPSAGMFNRAVEEILKAASGAAAVTPPLLHLLLPSLDTACGADDDTDDGKAHYSSVPAEVTCGRCMRTPVTSTKAGSR